MKVFTSLSLVLFLASITASSQKKLPSSITIDAKIATEVNKRIKPVDGADGNRFGMQIIKNTVIGSFTTGDSTLTLNGEEIGDDTFKGFHFKENETTVINGTFIVSSMADDLGFILQINGNETKVYFISRLLYSKAAVYSLNKTDSLNKELKVVCNDYDITLSAIPKCSKKEIIYGCVRFSSDPYFTYDEETNVRIPCKTSMKIYFKSSRINKEELFGTDKKEIEFYTIDN